MSGPPSTRPAPRLSGLPTPRISGIPAPGRPRSSIGSTGTRGTLPKPSSNDEEENERLMLSSLAAAVKARNPSDYLPPEERPAAPRKSLAPRPSILTASTLRPPRPPSASSQASHTSASRLNVPDSDSPNSFHTALSTPFHTPGISRARTPSTTIAIANPNPRITPSYGARRPESRQSIGSVQRSSSRIGHPDRSGSGSRLGRTFEVGDRVRLESKGWEGTLRYLGEVHFRDGLWAGVELLPGFAGKGKNDGSVEGCVRSCLKIEEC
ncbi:hypothetical protein CALVIDRAFT_534949 [Calocera viscosa TUFC12733]|uniref:CAP-Gly domain-containing protein n=1 Tax=Calocera viscosa (strain TUFC12733) TaxID=1330018 RepID=A0A167PJH9_CALVF|nr:hypothetical protein CALVIDRAFT_534949 [Calocera viscosa TUFC12733]